ncbi:MAG TPA: hypothetical protein VGO92_06315 [Acidimicrobiales bacterium]|jgi:hypothetical protein|nr:hypothetical protein [Acidimicrobiales bacterium]
MATKQRRPLRRLRKLMLLGTVAAGVVAWREREMTRNAERYGPPAT